MKAVKQAMPVMMQASYARCATGQAHEVFVLLFMQHARQIADCNQSHLESLDLFHAEIANLAGKCDDN